MLRAWGSEGGYDGLPLQARGHPLHDGGVEVDEPGGFHSLTQQKPIIFSEKGGKIL